MTTTLAAQKAPEVGECAAELSIVGRSVAADGVVTLTLADPNGSSLPRWQPARIST
ncbi:hypothetical protein [Gordonia asplenii]|uniref:hypothetical protein n=1 Tax=Gordonia asplenii TaxID=2725283 RepID=UPI0028B087D7|nr:hypothetical protein [Gordonia asplenii]